MLPGVATTFRQIAAPVRHEIAKIKGSRFIADASPVATEDDALARVAAIRAEHPDARHWCWAYRLGPGRDHFRYADDGEPSGTAGAPILRQIDGHGVTDALVVVTRYFGGTKLGTGPLARAYAAAAAAALDDARVVERTACRSLRVRHAYDDSGAVRGVLRAHGLEPAAETYGAEVTLALDVPEDDAPVVAQELRDATGGRAGVTMS